MDKMEVKPPWGISLGFIMENVPYQPGNLRCNWANHVYSGSYPLYTFPGRLVGISDTGISASLTMKLLLDEYIAVGLFSQLGFNRFDVLVD